MVKNLQVECYMTSRTFAALEPEILDSLVRSRQITRPLLPVKPSQEQQLTTWFPEYKVIPQFKQQRLLIVQALYIQTP
jgi:hypothetical protein